MQNKKGDITIVWILLAVIFFFILTTIGSRLLGKSGAEAYDLLSQTEDIEGDGIANAFDKCPCLEGTLDNDGCPHNIRTEEDKKRYKEYQQKHNYPDCKKYEEET